MTHTVLIVDDEESIRTSLRGILEDEDYQVAEASSGEEALGVAARRPVDAVLLDIWMAGIDGIETLRRLKGMADPPTECASDDDRIIAEIPVIMMSGHGTIDTAVSATKNGAYDFLEKPLSLDRVLLLLERAIREFKLVRENRVLKARMTTDHPMIGETPVMRELEEQLKRLAPTGGSVLITGENGAGKEVVARRIHKLSNRRDGPFVTVNSAAIPEPLIESELFGQEAGLFGASGGERTGRFEQAHGGTLFLDEIGDMSLKTQAKILRILQERRFRRVGGSREIQVDVRVIAASNKDLDAMIADSHFREDLFYRLNVIPLRVPPLRERREDIPALVAFFTRNNPEVPAERTFSKEALEQLKAYHWPGNVRELKNLVERLLIMAPGPEIQPRDLAFSLNQEAGAASQWEALMTGDLRSARESFERAFLETHLERCQGNISRTAEAVGMERSALHRKLKALGLG